VIFVGDRHQAIYGFRGADTHAIDTIARRFGTQSLPLHVCWRCPTAVISFAQSLVPYIHARPGAPTGVVGRHAEADLIRFLAERNLNVTHLVLCRVNAPLVELAMKLFDRDIPCHLKADAFQAALLKLLQQVREAHWIKVNTLSDRLKRYRDWKRQNQLEQGEELIEKNDQMESLMVIVDALQRRRAAVTELQVEQVINQIFQPDLAGGHQLSAPDGQQHGLIRLSTIHQCKGQEEDVIYLIKPSLLPHPAASDPWQLEQEDNLKYVAITRAKQEFHLIMDEEKQPRQTTLYQTMRRR
jgi:superfamily I DNA/RNA helicase